VNDDRSVENLAVAGLAAPPRRAALHSLAAAALAAPRSPRGASLAAALGATPKGEDLDRLVARHFPGFKLDADLREAILKRQLLMEAMPGSPAALGVGALADKLLG
jgi:hypothetical protein